MSAFIDLQAGPSAFGDGAHPSTQGMLLALDALSHLRGVQNALDMGCGSGILALKAAYQWHCHVLAVDKDPQAVQTTHANAAHNRLAALIEVLQSDRCTDARIVSQAPYDLIMANILTEPLLQMAHDLNQLLTEESLLLLSGMLRWQAPTLENAYQALGLTLLQRYVVGDWVTLLWQKQ